jgi:hypothetical protein
MGVAQALLSHAIDYAGLFPPAGLDLRTTVRNYEEYRAGVDAWALGRLILPAKIFGEFVAMAPTFAEEWPISFLLDDGFGREVDVVEGRGFVLNAVECKLAEMHRIAEVRRRLPEAELYIEVPTGGDLDEWLAAIADAKACAKIRMGGVTAEAIPRASSVADLLLACARRGVRLKATAGLHHAIRAEHSLTYEPQSARAVMHGFVNFFVAAGVVFGRGEATAAEGVLGDDSAANFQAETGELRWRERSFSVQQIERMRESFAMSFGSCSFAEPLEDMRAMGWMR